MSEPRAEEAPGSTGALEPGTLSISRRRRPAPRRGEHPADRLLEARIRARLGSFAPNTQLALGADWRIWHGFIEASRARGEPRQLWPLTPPDLVAFIYALSPPLTVHDDGTVHMDSKRAAGRPVRRLGTIRRYLASLRTLTRLAGRPLRAFSHPEIAHALRTIGRGRGAARPKAGPVRLTHVQRLLADRPGGLADARDRALIALAYCALLRPTECARVRVEDLRPSSHGGAVLHLPVSKADPEARGQHRPVDTRVYHALCHWLAAARISEGPVFRAIDRYGTVAPRALTRGAVSLIFKRLAPRMGLHPSQVSGHSGRIGAVHDLQQAGFATAAIAQAGGWATEAMVIWYGREQRAAEGAMARLWQQQTRPVVYTPRCAMKAIRPKRTSGE